MFIGCKGRRYFANGKMICIKNPCRREACACGWRAWNLKYFSTGMDVAAYSFRHPHNRLAINRLPFHVGLSRQTGRFGVPSGLFQPKGKPVLQRNPRHASTQPPRGKHYLPPSENDKLAGAKLVKRKKAAPCCHDAALYTATKTPLNPNRISAKLLLQRSQSSYKKPLPHCITPRSQMTLASSLHYFIR